MKEKISFLGIPILNRGDMLERLIISIDYPVETLFIINNGNDEGVQAAIDKIATQGLNPLIECVEVYNPGKNLGVGPSWNLMMAKYPNKPYWVICGNDIEFSRPGDLKKMHDFINENHTSLAAMYAEGYSCFCITQRGLREVGTFDENIFPAYTEDCDHYYRLALSKAASMGFPDVKVKSGDDIHKNSLTIMSNEKYRIANDVTHGANLQYYKDKWGGLPHEEIYLHPFNNPAIPVNNWELDIERRKKQEEAWA